MIFLPHSVPPNALQLKDERVLCISYKIHYVLLTVSPVSFFDAPIVSNVFPGWEDPILPIFFAFEADAKSLVLVNLEWSK